MHHTIRLTLLLTLALVLPVSVTHAQSLWKQRHSNRAFLYYDTPAREIGDLLTVQVLESTDVQNRDARSLDRDASSSGGFTLAGAINGALGSKATDANFNATANGNGNFGSSSAYSVAQGFTDQITVTVVERLPNGNLRIAGRRERVVSGERRSLKVSGIVRPIDISPANVVQSPAIANFQICYGGDGIESKFTEQGWMTRAWNKYRPF